MKQKAVTIIMPLHNPDKELLKEIEGKIKKQDYKGKVNVLKIEEGLGLADSLNYGIKKAKTEIVISLHQDCVPYSNNWLSNLVEPLEKENIVASVSKVELPFEFWNSFGFFAKLMSAKEQKLITPLMDEKACAYKKSILIQAGLFDGKTFRTAGEDFDMFIKLKKLGEIAYPDCKILHYHKHTFKNRLKKELQLSEGFGVLVRVYGKEMPGWHIGFAKAIPILGWLVLLINFPYSRVGIKSLCWLPLSLLINLIYCYGFWKGFLNKKQRV